MALVLTAPPTCHPAAMVVPPQPQPLLSSVDARQLAAQQQNFINQQALLLVRVGRAPRLPGRDRSVGRARPALTWSVAPPPQAQQMTAQAMSLTLEQQTQQRQRQAQATSAVAPKPKKPPAPQEEPEPELERVGVCLRVRSGDRRGQSGWGGRDERQGRGVGRCRKDAIGPQSQGLEGFAVRGATWLAVLFPHFPFLPGDPTGDPTGDLGGDLAG